MSDLSVSESRQPAHFKPPLRSCSLAFRSWSEDSGLPLDYDGPQSVCAPRRERFPVLRPQYVPEPPIRAVHPTLPETRLPATLQPESESLLPYELDGSSRTDGREAWRPRRRTGVEGLFYSRSKRRVRVLSRRAPSTDAWPLYPYLFQSKSPSTVRVLAVLSHRSSNVVQDREPNYLPFQVFDLQPTPIAHSNYPRQIKDLGVSLKAADAALALVGRSTFQNAVCGQRAHCRAYAQQHHSAVIPHTANSSFL